MRIDDIVTLVFLFVLIFGFAFSFAVYGTIIKSTPPKTVAEARLERLTRERSEIAFKLTSTTLTDEEIVSLNKEYNSLTITINHLNRKKL
jgi:hypothetical protein